MVSPDEVAGKARKKERQNFKFRKYLKIHADEKTLDAQFLRLHNELFTDYDCGKCRNCCKLFHAEIPAADIEKDAACLGMMSGEFVKTYLKPDEYGIEYITKNRPCDFLREDGECMLGDNKPESCANYPHTNQPERLLSLLSFIENVGICPVAFEICERLKEEYDFR